MTTELLISNITNPTLLFFLLGIVATLVRSDLDIPEQSIKFISLYLLFSIGFKGGQELAHSSFSMSILYSLLIAIVLAALIPFYAFFLLKRRFSISDAGAIAAAYGSVSAVTFVAATAFLEIQNQPFGGHMIAVMALMESPAIIVAVLLMNHYGGDNAKSQSIKTVVHHAFTNGSVLMIVGSLIIGIVADEKQAEGIKPFTTDIFKGFLAIFLLEMGMVTARRFKTFRQYGLSATAFALLLPLFNGVMLAILSGLWTDVVGDRFLFAVLAASASYIAVPAAMRVAAPQADPGLYIPMALGVTFPFNITLGMPLFYNLILMT